MFRIAIAEDSSEELKALQECLSYTEKKLNTSFLIDTYDNGIRFLSNERAVYDIVFLDIEMPGLDGMETARKLRKTDKNVMIIFVTNLAHMAVEGYEVEAFDFIVKPVKKEMFLIKMERALSRVRNSRGEGITIREHDQTVSILTDSVIYAESDGHYVIYHTLEGTYREYLTLKECEKKVNSTHFMRCNQCYLVNFRYVESFSGQEVCLRGGVLLMSRNQKKPFIDAYAKYLGDMK